MIVEYDRDGNQQKTFLNTPRFAPFAETYQSVALSLTNTADFADMLRNLEERGKVNPTLHYVHKQLMEKIGALEIWVAKTRLLCLTMPIFAAEQESR